MRVGQKNGHQLSKRRVINCLSKRYAPRVLTLGCVNACLTHSSSPIWLPSSIPAERAVPTAINFAQMVCWKERTCPWDSEIPLTSSVTMEIEWILHVYLLYLVLRDVWRETSRFKDVNWLSGIGSWQLSFIEKKKKQKNVIVDRWE